MLPKLLNALDGSHAIALAFDPNEPRDESGKWTDEGQHPYHVYPLQMKDREGAIKTMYGVQSLDNYAKGVKAGFGDTVHQSEAEAHKHAAIQHRNAGERAKYEQKREAEKKAAEDAKAAKYGSLAGFTEGMTPHKTAKAVEYLNKPIRYAGKEHTIKALVEHVIDDEGRSIRMFEGKRVLEHKDGRFLTEKSLGKTGMDYASHYLAGKG